MGPMISSLWSYDGLKLALLLEFKENNIAPQAEVIFLSMHYRLGLGTNV